MSEKDQEKTQEPQPRTQEEKSRETLEERAQSLLKIHTKKRPPRKLTPQKEMIRPLQMINNQQNFVE